MKTWMIMMMMKIHWFVTYYGWYLSLSIRYWHNDLSSWSSEPSKEKKSVFSHSILKYSFIHSFDIFGKRTGKKIVMMVVIIIRIWNFKCQCHNNDDYDDDVDVMVLKIKKKPRGKEASCSIHLKKWEIYFTQKTHTHKCHFWIFRQNGWKMAKKKLKNVTTLYSQLYMYVTILFFNIVSDDDIFASNQACCCCWCWQIHF